MITDSQVWAEMEARGIRTQYDDSEYWGVNEDFHAIKACLVKESYDEIKCFLQHPFINYSGDKLVKTASKLQENFLSNDIEEAVWIDEGLPAIDYKGYFITIQGAKWDVEEVGMFKDLYAALLQIDLLEL